MQTIWPAYEGSVRTSWYPVMEVLKTISPHASAAAAQDRPRNVRPSSNANNAGFKLFIFVQSLTSNVQSQEGITDFGHLTLDFGLPIWTSNQTCDRKNCCASFSQRFSRRYL